jgi:hypothetical protein
MGTEIIKDDNELSAPDMEKLVMHGDLNVLTAEGRLIYYNRRCQDLGLDPLAKPFDFLVLNGKMVLYANKGCFEQLRGSRKISITITARERFDDLFVVTARAMMPDGRCDEATGAVDLSGKKGENAANAIMKAETKAKRRVTLSICGLGMLDETEVDSIAGASRVAIDSEGHLIGETKTTGKHDYRQVWKDKPVLEHVFEQGSHDYCKECFLIWTNLPTAEKNAFAAAYTEWLKTGATMVAFPESQPVHAAPAAPQPPPANRQPAQSTQPQPAQSDEAKPDYSLDTPPSCETCRVPMNLVRAGVSKAGKAYGAFWSCPNNRTCGAKTIHASKWREELMERMAPVNEDAEPDPQEFYFGDQP